MIRSTVARALVTAVVLLAATRTVANATMTLTTPFVDSAGSPALGDCVVTNISASPVLVSSVQLFDGLGGAITPDYDDCTQGSPTLPAHSSCHVFKYSTPNVYCTAAASSAKIRVSLNLLDGGYNTIVTVPGTK